MIKFIVKAKYKNSPAEKIDSAETTRTADYLQREYSIAFGSGWVVWYEPV